MLAYKTVLYTTKFIINFSYAMSARFVRSSLLLLLCLFSKVKSGTYLTPSSGFFVAPITIQESNAPHRYLQSILFDIPDILKCLPRFIAGKISSGTESVVLSMTQPANYVIDEKMMEEGFMKCFGGVGGSNGDAAGIFLRKLGNKIIKEDDWRVAGKSLFIMHQILTSSSLNGEVIRQLAESYLDRYNLLLRAVQIRQGRSEGDKHALLWVQQYIEYLRSLSEVIRRRSGGREFQDIRSVLRLSSGYCQSAGRLLDASVSIGPDSLSPFHSSRAFFSQLSSSCNSLVQSDVRAHSKCLKSLQISHSASCSLQQESLSEVQRHAKEIRDTISYILTPSPVVGSIVTSGSHARRSGTSSRSISRQNSGSRESLFHGSDVDSFVDIGKGNWLESLAEMQCDINLVESVASNVQDEITSSAVDSRTIKVAHVSSRKRNRLMTAA